jgi:hypothetical protein
MLTKVDRKIERSPNTETSFVYDKDNLIKNKSKQIINTNSKSTNY